MNFRDYLKGKESKPETKEEKIEESIDQSKVKQAAIEISKEVYGDDVDQKKVDGMVKKAIGMAKDTEDAIGIVQSFFKEEKSSPADHALKILEGIADKDQDVNDDIQETIPTKQKYGDVTSQAFNLL